MSESKGASRFGWVAWATAVAVVIAVGVWAFYPPGGWRQVADNELADNELADNELADSEIPDSEIPDSEIPDSEIANHESGGTTDDGETAGSKSDMSRDDADEASEPLVFDDSFSTQPQVMLEEMEIESPGAADMPTEPTTSQSGRYRELAARGTIRPEDASPLPTDPADAEFDSQVGQRIEALKQEKERLTREKREIVADLDTRSKFESVEARGEKFKDSVIQADAYRDEAEKLAKRLEGKQATGERFDEIVESLDGVTNDLSLVVSQTQSVDDEKDVLVARLEAHADRLETIIADEKTSGDQATVRRFQEQLRKVRENIADVQGRGPGEGGDKYARIYENPFVETIGERALSTFSIDVDTASYANVRQFLISGTLPPPDAVRIEELVNYFDYQYEPPKNDTPFASHVEVASCPWKPEHRLARIALKGHEIDDSNRKHSNLVFLLDVSGSMSDQNKLPLVKKGMKMLAEHLGESDRVSIVVYAGSEGLALPATPGYQREKIVAALDNLHAGGSTAGGAGITLAYKIAKDNFLPKGNNRVILCTDGDFNVGTTSTAELERLVEEKAKQGTFLTVLGFGRGNLNDAMLETITNKGNGNYYYIDSETEAHKVLVEQMGSTLVTIAKDVKIQVEFNPAQVAAYRLIGYENRMLRNEDFHDDTKDAGEIGAGHTVTAIYELVPPGEQIPGTDERKVDKLKYQKNSKPAKDESEELLTLKLRYKPPTGDKSKLLEFPIEDEGQKFSEASSDYQFAAAVASFGMKLRNSRYAGDATWDAVIEIAEGGIGEDEHGYRKEFVDLVRKAKMLSGE